MEIPAGFFNVSFNKAMAFGYRTEDVDEFVTQALHIARELQEENEALQQKLEILASNLENYRE
ncbi:MAG: DivIVA domain-containing protein, partial [Angelakisella sp.]